MPPIEDLRQLPLQLPGEALTAGHKLTVEGLGVDRQDVVVVSPTLKVVGIPLKVPIAGAAGVRAALS